MLLENGLHFHVLKGTYIGRRQIYRLKAVRDAIDIFQRPGGFYFLHYLVRVAILLTGDFLKQRIKLHHTGAIHNIALEGDGVIRLYPG